MIKGELLQEMAALYKEGTSIKELSKQYFYSTDYIRESLRTIIKLGQKGGRTRRLTDDEIRETFAMWEQGYTKAEIARLKGVSVHAFSNHFARLGLEPTVQRTLPTVPRKIRPHDDEVIMRLYKEGASISLLAVKYGVTYEAIRWRIRKNESEQG